MEVKELNQIIARIKNQEITALEDFYINYANVICSIAYLFVDNISTTEDILNDILIHVWNKAATIPYINNPRAWLYTVVKNHCLNINKKEKRMQATEDLCIATDTFTITESNIQFYQMIAPLTRLEQQIIIYKIVLNYTFREIAATLKLSEANAAKIYYRALEKIII